HMRAIADRIVVGDDERHDLLMLNIPASHAANAREFVEFAEVMAGASGTAQVAYRFLVKLPRAVGRPAATRMRKTLQKAVARKIGSLSQERYWSQAPILWGDAGPVQYQLRPSPGGPPAPKPDRSDRDRLRTELAARLRERDVVYELCLQRFADEATTPVENASVEWPEDVAPPVPVATLTLPRQDLDSNEAVAVTRRIEQLVFTPWRTTDAFRPLGNLNRSRDAAYGASSARRLGLVLEPRPAPGRPPTTRTVPMGVDHAEETRIGRSDQHPPARGPVRPRRDPAPERGGRTRRTGPAHRPARP
ncbi:hypothetical protein ACFWX8_31810, partial [Streptomyces violascens]